MSLAPAPLDVRRSSVRVALASTGVVAAVYVAVAVAVVLIVTGNLTRQVDDRLTSFLSHAAGEPTPQDGQPPDGPGDRPFGPPVLAWLVSPSGRVSASTATPADATLPATALTTTDPITVTINGTPVRLAGAAFESGRLIVGQDMTDVVRTQSTLVLAELVIGPVLLLVVFVGAFAIGRRVATPFEVARRRQLEFTADASHELRTPLSVIEANTSLALQQDRQGEWYRTAFGRVDRESKRMRRLLEDLLWLARFDTTQGQPASEPVDVGVLAAQTADRFAAVAEARHLHLAVVAPDGGLVISAPPEWLDRLLGVLLDNACKYAPEGGTVRVAVGLDGGRVQISVDDSGPGIPAAERERVFDRFHRATDAAGGAGLGLAIADAIVRATNGRWRLGTSPEGGARMSASWPRAMAGTRGATVRRAAAPADGSADRDSG